MRVGDHRECLQGRLGESVLLALGHPPRNELCLRRTRAVAQLPQRCQLVESDLAKPEELQQSEEPRDRDQPVGVPSEGPERHATRLPEPPDHDVGLLGDAHLGDVQLVERHDGFLGAGERPFRESRQPFDTTWDGDLG